MKFKTFYSNQGFSEFDSGTHSIFLAGPTPRSLKDPSWRPDALKILERLDYKGQVFIPEWTVKEEHINYDNQVEWEYFGLENCTKVVVWVPRDLVTMPAFTTNVEFGLYVKSGKMVYGRPDKAPKNRYLDWCYKKHNQLPVYNNLENLLKKAIQ